MRTAPQAIAATKATKTNKPGYCQQDTWQMYQAKPAGDRDHDKDADAVDGWLSEPVSARHTNRRPKIGAACAWSGGSRGNGHRAICIAYRKIGGVWTPIIRSTDAGGRGVKANKPLAWFEEHWGLHWLGWSDTITGMPIEGLKNPPSDVPARPHKTRGKEMDLSLAHARKVRAKKGSVRAARLSAYIKAGEAVPFIK